MIDSVKIYHIVHHDRLRSIVADGFLWSGAKVADTGSPGTDIGMSTIKQRRMVLPLRSRPGLRVGDCVPFYFCPRSVMLYVLHKGNHPDLDYQGGQDPVVHLEADLGRAVEWADQHALRWAFTTSNAGARYFDDYADLSQLHRVDWAAMEARYWSECMDEKQAEFLIESQFPWSLVERVGFRTRETGGVAWNAVRDTQHRPLTVLIPIQYG